MCPPTSCKSSRSLIEIALEGKNPQKQNLHKPEICKKSATAVDSESVIWIEYVIWLESVLQSESAAKKFFRHHWIAGVVFIESAESDCGFFGQVFAQRGSFRLGIRVNL